MTQSGTTTVSKAQSGVREELPLEAALAPRGGVVVTLEGIPVCPRARNPSAPRHRGQRGVPLLPQCCAPHPHISNFPAEASPGSWG